jgi:hypothetical protein
MRISTISSTGYSKIARRICFRILSLKTAMALFTQSRIRFFSSACGWILLLLIGTEVFTHLFLVTSFPSARLSRGNIFEISGIEGYGFTRYLPYAEIKTPYDSGEYSVVVLGNSYTMSKQVMDWQSYVSVAETLLREEGVEADLHNLGINGLSLPSYIARSSFVLEQYKPDVVVVQVSPDEFLSLGFKEAMAGGHFAFNEAGMLEVVPPKSAGNLLPEQMGPDAPSADLWSYSSIAAYVSFLQKQDRERYARDTGVNLKGHAPADIAAQELQLLADAYGDVPLVFVLVPQDIVIGEKSTRYQDSDNYKMIVSFIAHRHPEWKVIYPVKEFNQLLQTGYAPKGFENSKPFVGHMNVHGHRALGELLASVLETMLK